MLDQTPLHTDQVTYKCTAASSDGDEVGTIGSSKYTVTISVDVCQMAMGYILFGFKSQLIIAASTKTDARHTKTV